MVAAVFVVQCAIQYGERRAGQPISLPILPEGNWCRIYYLVGMKTEHFQITAGQLSVYNSSAGVERGFCSKCGTSLTYVAEGRWPGEVSILAPTLDDPRMAVPTVHTSVEDKLPWIKLSDGLPAEF